MTNGLDAKLIENVKRYLSEQPDILLAYLFGSFARKEANSLSDIDIAILLPGTISASERFDRRLALGLALQRILHHNEVDVVILNDSPLALAYRVLRDGQLLCCQDEDVRIQYRAEIISRYLDFKPFIERHHQAILERARQGELLNGYNPYRGALERYRQGRTRLAGSAAGSP
ncbi:MAG: nucleotidyltransferase domain-containing protein [Caldilineaceae bacterium]